MFFGRVLGVIVNYHPDHAVFYDLGGNAVETLPEAQRIGYASVRLKGRMIPPAVLPAIESGT